MRLIFSLRASIGIVAFLLVACVPVTVLAQAYWNQPWQVKQCSGIGTRQYASQLMRIPGGRDWKSFCESMPADINQQHFDRPSRCIDNVGMWGEFDDVRDQCCAPFWGPFTPGICSSGSRIYSGRLWNITGD